jgi:hypothetical protein
MSAARGAIEFLKALQQSGNGGLVPFAASRRWCLSLVQLASDGQVGDKARFPKFTNCRAHGLSPRVRDPPDCQSVVAIASQPEAEQQSLYGGSMPSTAMGGQYFPPIQFLRQRMLGNEARRHKLSNGRG